MFLEMTAAAFLFTSLAVAALSYYAFYRTRNRKLLLMAIAMTVFAIEGALISWSLLNPPVDHVLLTQISLSMNLIVIVLLFLAVVLRRD